MLKDRLIEENDYPILVEWWKKWRFPVPPQEFLPENGTCGLLIEDDKNICYCAGFLYFTNSKVTWLEFIVSNPNVRDKELRTESLSLLIRKLNDLAKENGTKWMFTSVKNNNLRSRFLNEGFTKGSINTTEMIKLL